MNITDEEIVEKWRQALRMHRKPSRLAKLIALSIADELEKDGVTDADIDRLFPERKALAAAPASAPEPVEIKQLEWNPFRVETPWGYYHIDDQRDLPTEELKGRLPFLLTGSRLDMSRHQTLADAKAAAQADFEALIRSVLITT